MTQQVDDRGRMVVTALGDFDTNKECCTLTLTCLNTLTYRHVGRKSGVVHFHVYVPEVFAGEQVQNLYATDVIGESNVLMQVGCVL